MLGWFAIRAFTFSEAMKGDRFGDYQLKPKNVPSGAFWAVEWTVAIGIL